MRRITGLMLLALAAAPGVTFAGTRIAFGNDMGFFKPEIDDAGLVAVIARGIFEDDSPGCADDVARDLVVFDVTEGCGNDVLRESQWIGEQRDASITSDGNLVAFWSPGSSGAEIYITGDNLSEPVLILTDTASNSLANLEISPTAQYIVYRRFMDPRWDLILIDTAPLTPTVTVIDGDSALGLNDTHCVADSGMVLYTKPSGGSDEIFKYKAGDAFSQFVDTGLSGDKSLVAVSRDGERIVFRLDDGTYANIATFDFTTATVIATATYSSWTISAVDISGDGSQAVWVSDGDFESSNADGSDELFRYDVRITDSPHQLTNLESSMGWSGFIFGASSNLTGTSIAYSAGRRSTAHASACTEGDFHSLETFLYLDAAMPIPSMSSAFVAPPFEMIAGTCTDETGTIGAWHCTATLRGSSEENRNVLLLTEWRFGPDFGCASGRHDRPLVPIELSTNTDVAVEDFLFVGTEAPCSPLQVTFIVTAVSPDVAQADKATCKTAFTYDP